MTLASTPSVDAATPSGQTLTKQAGGQRMSGTAYDFGCWLRSQKYAPPTCRNYVNYVTRAERTVPDLRRASTPELDAWMRTLTDAGARSAKKALLKWYEWKRIARNPATALVVAREPRRRPRPHTREARQAFVDAARSVGGIHEVAGILFASTAARFSSVRHARWHQFDLGTDPYWHLVGKGSNRSGPRTHTVPLHSLAVEVLKAWRSDRSRDWLFPGGSRGGVISESALRDVYRDICEEADIQSVPHQLRHTAATLVVEDTDNLAIAQELLGHDNISSTRIYAELRVGRVRDAVEALTL